MKIQLTTFQQALEKERNKKPHILLGNGFSRALSNDIFAYDALFDKANFSNLSEHARKAFEALATTDFEIIIKHLQSASLLGALYGGKEASLAQMNSDAEGLKDVLVETIARSHPDLPAEIAPGQYLACKNFLAPFHRIYSTNYDLLLYWTLMHDGEPNLKCDDGFRTPETGKEDYVTYSAQAHDQNIYYMHGALHLFDTETELQKYTWVNTGIPLIPQIRQALDNHKYPLFVAEGTSDQKFARIRRSDYLYHCYKSLSRIGGDLFAYGFSFSENDAHIISQLKHSKVTGLYIGIYGDINSDNNQQMLKRVNGMISDWGRKDPPGLFLFDSSSAKVWG
ncbi:MAG: DUF4917 family protein [Anaerolineales bacterium]|nr:DUF4917 family protein [Anaerolineales bacterium]